MVVDRGRGLCIDVIRVHDFHGNAANPLQNGTLRHTDINLVLSQRAQEKIDKYRAGYAAQDMRRAFLPAVVSTSGRIHGDLGCDCETYGIGAENRVENRAVCLSWSNAPCSSMRDGL